MKKRFLSLVLALGMASSLLIGCGSNSADKPVDTKPAADGTQAQNEGNQEASDQFTDTITIICPVKAGGDTDRNARVIAEYMEKYAGVSVVVENVDGGASVMGMQQCLDATPDGNTIVINGIDLFVPYMQGNSDINIDSFKTIAIPLIDNTTVLAVNKNSGWETLEDLLKASQAAPDSIEYGGKIGAANQICGIAMNEAWNAGLKFVDVGNNAAKMTALLGEQTDVINISYALATDYFTTGEFIPLCLLGSEKNELLADVPMASDYNLSNVDFSKFIWFGTSPEVSDEKVQALADVMKQVTEDPEFIKTMESYYLTIDYMAGQEAADFANKMYTDTLLPYKDAFLEQQ